MTLIDYMCQEKKEGRGLSNIEDSVDASVQWVDNYIEKRGGRLITASRNNTDNTKNNRMIITKKQKWEEKQLYGRFKGLTSDISHKKTWNWPRKENYGDKDETINDIISEYRILAQKE